MKLLIKPYFIISFMLFLIDYYSIYSPINLPSFFSNYLADLVCLPVILTGALAIIKWIKNDASIWLTTGMIVFAWVAVSVSFELYLPDKVERYKSDYWDIVAYGVGGISFYYYQQKLKRSFPTEAYRSHFT